MNHRYLILYLIAGTLALLLLVYQLIVNQLNFNTGRVILNAIASAFFYYLAYKTYHEKKDKELM